MTKSETVRLLTMIKVIFPKTNYISPDKNEIEFDLTVSCWHRLLGDIDFNVLDIALQKYALTSPYPPAIADLRKSAIEIMTPKNERIDSASAWGEVVIALRRYGHVNEARALKSFSPTTRQVVEIIGWPNLCKSDNQIADRKHFCDMFTTYQTRKNREKLLPAALQDSIAKICDKSDLKLIEGGKVA